MTIHGWKQLFAPQILERGKEYWLEDRVELLEVTEDSVTAEVSGGEDYEVEIELTGDGVADMFCSCPYAEDGNNCKHMAAVLFKLTEVDSMKNTKLAELEKVIMGLEPDEAKRFLLEVCKNSAEIAEKLTIRYTGRITAENVRRWTVEMKRIARSYMDDYGLMDEDDFEDYAIEMGEYLDAKIPLLLELGMIMEAFWLVSEAYQISTSVDNDGYDEDLYTLPEVCVEHWKAIIEHADAEQIRRLYSWFSKEYLQNQYGCLEEVLLNGFTDEESVRCNYKLLDKLIAAHAKDIYTYSLEHHVRNRMELMSVNGAPEDEIRAFENRFYHLPSIRGAIIDRYIGLGQYDNAIGELKKSKKIDQNDQRLAAKHSKRLIELYRDLGRTEELRAELTEYIEGCNQHDLQYVKMLRDITPSEGWPEERERLLTLDSMRNAVNPLLEDEGLYSLLLDRIVSGGDINVMNMYAKTLKEHYPHQVRDFYAEYLRKGMRFAAKRNQYAGLAQMLKSLKNYPDGAETVKAIAKEWRTEYPRRRSMIEEMNKAGV